MMVEIAWLDPSNPPEPGVDVVVLVEHLFCFGRYLGEVHRDGPRWYTVFGPKPARDIRGWWPLPKVVRPQLAANEPAPEPDRAR